MGWGGQLRPQEGDLGRGWILQLVTPYGFTRKLRSAIVLEGLARQTNPRREMGKTRSQEKSSHLSQMCDYFWKPFVLDLRLAKPRIATTVGQLYTRVATSILILKDGFP